MKKIYNNPIVTVLAVEAEDIITLSLNVMEKGEGKVMTIEDIMDL